MSDLASNASPAVAEDPVRAYVNSLLQALGSREPMAALAEAPEALRRAVAGLSHDQDGTPERPGKWSVRQVVQHLADSELVGGFRFRMVLAHDAPELPAYDQDLWAERLRYQDADLETSLADFALLRALNLRVLRRATPDDLATRVMRHAERGDEPLGHMITLYAGHDLVHLAQIRRIRQAIGAPAAT
jgi:DinB superfamily